MTLTNKVRFFYDTVKIKGAVPQRSVKIPLSFAIPAAAVSVALSAAFIIPTIIKLSARKGVKKPTGAV